VPAQIVRVDVVGVSSQILQDKVSYQSEIGVQEEVYRYKG
jgi:hypothetical protein